MASPKNPGKKRAIKRTPAEARRLSPRGFVRTTVMLTPEQVAWLKGYAHERMTPAAYVLRTIIDNYRAHLELASQVGASRSTVAEIQDPPPHMRQARRR